MSKIRNKDSKIEIIVRKKLWSEGFRYRKNSTKYFGKPDIVLPKYKTVIFIDSCFWHSCSKHFAMPATRKEFWRKKIERNRKRDKVVNSHYKKNGWEIIRIWEHDLSEPKLLRKIRSIIKKSDNSSYLIVPAKRYQ